MPRLPQPKQGDLLKTTARGFPCFYGKKRLSRIITGDIWAFFHYISEKGLKRAKKPQAYAYIDQAHDFYSSAATQCQSARPLLYYYAFMNLAKVFLLHKGIDLPPKLKHGISDPKANTRERLHLKSQVVEITGRSHDHSELFPELIYALAGKDISGDFKIVELLGQIPAIHRTLCTATSMNSLFCPIKSVRIYRNGKEIWARIVIYKNDRDAKHSLNIITSDKLFKDVFHPTAHEEEDEIDYESCTIPFVRKGIEAAIGNLATKIRSCGVYTILTIEGYHHYLIGTKQTTRLPQVCAAYATMFYLGSITRYKPYDFDKILGKYSWVVSDFLNTQPVQLLHILASHIAETEVVLPHAKSLEII